MLIVGSNLHVSRLAALMAQVTFDHRNNLVGNESSEDSLPAMVDHVRCNKQDNGPGFQSSLERGVALGSDCCILGFLALFGHLLLEQGESTTDQ